MSLLRRSLAALALCFPLAAAAQAPPADTLTFTNGDKLTGKLEKAAGGSITFKSDMAGEITVSFDKVKELTSSGKFVEIAKSAKPVKNPAVVEGAIAVNGATMTVTPAAAAPQTVAVKDVGYLIDQAEYAKQMAGQKSFFHDWNGSINGGATLVRSTQTSTTLTAGVALVRAIPAAPYLPGHSRTTVNATETYGKQTSPVIPPPPVTNPPTPTTIVVKTSIFHADAENDEYFSPRGYWLVDTAFDHNFSQGLALQQIYGGGAGYTAIKSAKQTLDLKAEVHYEMQSFLAPEVAAGQPQIAAAPSINLFGSTFSENYTRNLPRKLVFTETGNVIPGWTQTKAYAANVTAGLAIPVYKRLNASISATDNFLNDPAPFYRKNSFQFVTGVTYNLK